MKVTYTEKARQKAEQFGLLQQATTRLEDALGGSSDLVTAQWDRTEDEKGQPLYVLRLKDFTDEVTGRFSLDELQSPAQTSFRVYRLWGDLLHIQNQKLLDGLTGAGGSR